MRMHRALAVLSTTALLSAGIPAAADDRAAPPPDARTGPPAEADAKPRAGDAPAGGAQAMDATAGQIAGDPAGFVGRSVRVKAEVEDVHGPRAFTLDEDRVGAEPDVLVLAPQTIPRNLENKQVTVTGPVRTFVRVELEREYEWFDAGDFGDPDVVARFETRPVIMARSIRDAEGRELVPAAGAPRTDAEQRAQPKQKQ
jgi:hypothetical protein